MRFIESWPRSKEGKALLYGTDTAKRIHGPMGPWIRNPWGYALTWLLGCSPAPSSHTAPVAPEVTELSASCEQDPSHPLRVRCTVERSPAGPVRLQVGERELMSEVEQSTHELVIWGLAPSRELDWRAEAGDEERSGAVNTGTIPPEIEVGAEVEGEPPSTEALLVDGCGEVPYALIYAPTGELLWYADLSEHGDEVQTVSWTEEDTVLAMLDNRMLVEVDPAYGTISAVSTEQLGLSGALHHDAMLRNGLWYALYAYPQDELVLDGVYIIDPMGQLVADLPTDSWFDLDQIDFGWLGDGDGYWGFVFPGLDDASHANSVYVSEDYELLFSAKNRDAVFAADGDPWSPTFGELRWVLEGGDDAAVEGTLELVSAATEDVSFDAQHCVRRGPSGALTMLDNKHRGTDGISRGLWLDVAADRGRAEILREVSLEHSCPEQSALFELEDGSALTTCSANQEILEFAPGAADPHWSMRLTCVGLGLLYRAQPVPLP